MKKYYGLLPAAGLGMRMRPFRYPKELLPVHFEVVQESDYIRPKLLIEYSLNAFSLGGVKDVYIVVPEWKPEIMRYLEDGEQFGQHMAYLYNSKALGLAEALLSGYSWLKSKNTCFAMPDTVFSPANAFESVNKMLESKNADLVLGVFPTDEAEHFAPVEFDENCQVMNIWEKPEHPKVSHIWGIASWTPVFWEYFIKQAANLEAGISITDIFDKAVKAGLKVFCVYFSEGWYKDVGRINQISVVNNGSRTA